MSHPDPVTATPRLARRVFLRSSIGGAAVLAARPSIFAQEATPIVSTPAIGGLTVETLLTGLLSPRYLAMDGDDVLFTEAGTGGDEPVFQTVGEGTPEPTAPISMTGHTGKLSRLSPDGTVTEIVTDFRSYTFGAMGEIVGAAGVALDGAGTAYVAVGAPGPFIGTMPLTGEESVIYQVNLTTGDKQVIADAAAHEISDNPDPVTIDSNLYGAAYAEDQLYVADSGGNSILVVDPASGELSTFAVTGGLDAPFIGEGGNPLRAGAQEIDSVPSCVVLGPDGRLYVSFVTGAPFPSGFAPIYAYALDGTQETVADGFTMVTDIAFSSDGTMYVLMMSTDFVQGGPGQVIRVAADGTRTIVIDNLVIPNGMVFNANDDLYLLEKVSGIPGGGELVKYSGVTTVTGVQLPLGTDSGTPQASPVASNGASEPITILMNDTYYDPNTVETPADVEVTLVLDNRGFLLHDLAIDDPKYYSGVVESGNSTQMKITLPAGEHVFYCTQVGHRPAGMEGVFKAV